MGNQPQSSQNKKTGLDILVKIVVVILLSGSYVVMTVTSVRYQFHYLKKKTGMAFPVVCVFLMFCPLYCFLIGFWAYVTFFVVWLTFAGFADADREMQGNYWT